MFGENKNYNVLNGHKNGVIEVEWLSEGSIVSCSADKSVALWDANKGVRIRKYTNHNAIVNSLSAAKLDSHIFISAGDDCQLYVWDSRIKQYAINIEHEYPILSTCLAADAQSLYFGGIDNTIL